MGNSLGLEVGKAPLTSPTVATNRTIDWCAASSDIGGMIMRASSSCLMQRTAIKCAV